MTTTARVLESPSPLVDALERELHPDPSSGLLGGALREVPWHVWHRALGAPLHEFLQRPGKEFRAELTRIFFALGGRKEPPPENLALIVEVLHAGSLIVDDIQDESEERRGGPALHQIHGVPLALNAGNWLYFWAYALLGEIDLPDEAAVRAHRLVTRALLDCHAGQGLDLSVRMSDVAQAAVPAVVRASTLLKTGSLLGLAAGLGALVGGATADAIAASARFGQDLGTGLQMLDDLSGLVSPRRAHKLRGPRQRPTLLGVGLARGESGAGGVPGAPRGSAARRAEARLVAAGGAPGQLMSQMRALLMPDARRIVHDHLESAFGRLTAAVPGPLSTTTALRRELDRLEKSYV
nr:CrtE [uncultured bacterium]